MRRILVVPDVELVNVIEVGTLTRLALRNDLGTFLDFLPALSR